MLNVFVVDDDKIIRKGLVSIIEGISNEYRETIIERHR